MAAATLVPANIYGVRSDVHDNVYYLDEQTVIYPAGAHLVLYNTENKSQRFISSGESNGKFTCMAVSPNRRYVAIAERAISEKDRPSLTVYDLQTLKKKKTLTLGDEDTQTQEFIGMAFAPDSKYLVTVGGTPDYTLHFWMWEKARGPIASFKCAPQPDMSVRTVTFHPQDATQVCVAGPNVFRLLRYVDNTIKQLPFHKLDCQSFLCQAWLSDERLVIGTDNGRVLLFDGNDQKAELHLYPEERKAAATASSTTTPQPPARVECFGVYSRGFVVGDSRGTVHVFERADEREFYRSIRRESLPSDLPALKQTVSHIALSPGEDAVVVSTDRMQLYRVNLVSADDGKADEGSMGFLIQPFHFSAITGVDVCVRKPLVATCSLDSSVRVWNYVDHTLDLCKFFGEEAYAVSMHPSGLQVLVGFSDKLRLMNLLMDDVRVCKEFNIRGCREVRFSHGGHLFAAVQGNIIQVFNSYTMENVGNMKGHNGKVRSLCWSHDDMRLVSCGLDGAIYEWSIQTFQRISENVLKSCSYTCNVMSADGKTVFAVGSDRTLKELNNCQIVHDVSSANKANPSEVVLTQVVVSNSGRAVIVSTAQGALRSMRLPLTNPAEWTSCAAHVGPVSKLRLSHDDQYLFSVGDDGTLTMFSLTDREGQSLKRDMESIWAEEVLIGKTDLEEKNNSVAELRTRVEELKMANEYQMRLKDMHATEKIKEVTDKLSHEIDLLKQQLEGVRIDKEKNDAQNEEQAAQVAESHQLELHELESQHAQKLLAEYEKNQELERHGRQIQAQGEEQLRQLDASKATALEELASVWQQRLDEKGSALDQARQDMTSLTRDYDETTRQIETDADREVLAIKNKYERQLKDERDTNLRLKGDNGILRNKLKGLSGEMEEHTKVRDEMDAEQKRLQSHIRALERDISTGKKEIEERDETIQDKEKRIYDLKKKNQELDKFKFVLDYKIKELKKQIEPREQEITEMKAQVSKMDQELATYHNINTSLNLQISELNSKLTAAVKESGSLRESSMGLRVLVSRFRSDLQVVAKSIQNPKALVTAVQGIHARYCSEDAQDPTMSLDEELQKEHNSQREYLERSIASLRHKLAKNEESHQADLTRVMKENVALIEELNNLRKELSGSQTMTKTLENTIRSTQRLAKVRGVAMDVSIDSRVETARDIDDVEQLQRIIQMQKDEIRRLRSSDARPASSGRLPALSASAVTLS